jgi:parvulin-like peptidyl-prolyl isomerase
MPLTVNGEVVDDALIREEANNLRPSYYEMMGGGDPISLEMQLKEWSRENVIERVLLRQAAPEGDVEKLLASVVADVPPPKYKEVGDYYKKHREDFLLPDMVRVTHVFEPFGGEGPDEATALANIQRTNEDLKQGLLFDSVAQELGWVPRGRMPDDLEQAIFSLELGGTTGILRSNSGYHIIRVHEKRESGIPGLQDVRAHVEGMILQARQQRVIEQYIDALKAKASIQKT